MDPMATLEIINDPDRCPGERLYALGDLADWLVKGGAMPVGAPGADMHPTLTPEAVVTLSEDGDPLACSVTVALAYGDLSGLEFLKTEAV